MIELSQLKDQKPFGQDLLEKGVISQEELATALSLQNQSADRIGKLFVDIGAISEADLTAHLSDYLGIPYMAAEELPEVPVLEGTFSVQFMRECKFIPVSLEEDKRLVLAMANPQDYSTLDHGDCGTYRKTHLWGSEKKWAQAGDALQVFSTPYGTLGS